MSPILAVACAWNRWPWTHLKRPEASSPWQHLFSQHRNPPGQDLGRDRKGDWHWRNRQGGPGLPTHGRQLEGPGTGTQHLGLAMGTSVPPSTLGRRGLRAEVALTAPATQRDRERRNAGSRDPSEEQRGPNGTHRARVGRQGLGVTACRPRLRRLALCLGLPQLLLALLSIWGLFIYQSHGLTLSPTALLGTLRGGGLACRREVGITEWPVPGAKLLVARMGGNWPERDAPRPLLG